MRRFRARSSAFKRSALPFVLLAASVPAGEDPAQGTDAGAAAARELFRKAVAAQGELKAQVRDVTLDFDGEVSGDGEIHTALRTYWYRAHDHSFRVRTKSGAVDKLSSDRGVLGASKYWERSSADRILDLSKGNRDDAAQIKEIEKERTEFERMFRMVLLARLDGDGWQVALAEPDPVRLERDQPHQAKGTLRNREKETYHVLELTREGEPRLRLFVDTADFTVRKAIEFDVKAPDRVRFVYYFANYKTDPELKLLVPQYLSVYRDTPLSEEDRDKLNVAKGLPKVRLNTGLADADLRPPAAG
jgi:hypothetical protein